MRCRGGSFLVLFIFLATSSGHVSYRQLADSGSVRRGLSFHSRFNSAANPRNYHDRFRSHIDDHAVQRVTVETREFFST